MTTFQDNIIINNEEDLFYQALISSVDDIIISTDKDFVIKTWNTAAERAYGLSADEAIGKKINELVFHQYINCTREEALKALINNNCWKGYVRVITSIGKPLILQSVVTTVRDVEGKKLGFVTVSRNVTDDLQNKQSLQNFSSILALLEESFLIIDRDYKVVFLRPKGNVQKFFNSDYKVGDDAFKYIIEPYINSVRTAYQKAFNGETVHYESESDTIPKLYFDVTYVPLKDDAGIITNVCVIIKDLTAQKEVQLLQQKKAAAEKSLYITRKFFEDFMENTQLLAWVVDEEGRIHYMNSAYADSFKTAKPGMETHISELYPPDIAKEYFENNKRIIETGTAFETIESRLTDDAATYKIIKFPIVYKDRIMVAGWGVNISDQIAMYESLSLLNQNKNKIVSVIAHDLRAPLSNHAGFINGIVEDYEKLTDAELKENLELLKKGILKCYELTEELLLWARSQLDTIRYNPRKLNASEEIMRVVDTLSYTAKEKDIIIRTVLPLYSEIYADADMFAIVLRNFISNAIKFSKPKSTITVSAKPKKDKLLVSVKDTGVGLREELAEKLLRKLNYESTFGTSGEKGAGLGLIIAKDYIERNNGKMYIESKPGKGSTFTFSVNLFKE